MITQLSNQEDEIMSKLKTFKMPEHVAKILDERGISFAKIVWTGINVVAPDMMQYQELPDFKTGVANPRYNPDLHDTPKK